MRRQDFHYDLPESLIARIPTEQRRDSRLLSLDGETGVLNDGQFTDILDRVESGDLMVFNDTKVIPARLFAQKETGGKVEILVERILDNQRILAHVRSSKSPKPGAKLVLEDGSIIDMLGREDALFELGFTEAPVIETLERIGHMPLPPYIDREDDASDRERYQTVYGKHKGAVAAPTAGLHFDQGIIEAIKKKGVNVAFVTLHVGAGTFQPVRVDDIKTHTMHSEYMQLSQGVADLVNQTKAAGKRVIAVGTTSVRSLETAATRALENTQKELLAKKIEPFQGDTQIFIYPGYEYKVVDALITNFHLPESTLIMLVSAFAGYKHTMAAYKHAVDSQYRFFSYGDAMFIRKNPLASSEKVSVESF